MLLHTRETSGCDLSGSLVGLRSLLQLLHMVHKRLVCQSLRFGGGRAIDFVNERLRFRIECSGPLSLALRGSVRGELHVEQLLLQ